MLFKLTALAAQLWICKYLKMQSKENIPVTYESTASVQFKILNVVGLIVTVGL